MTLHPSTFLLPLLAVALSAQPQRPPVEYEPRHEHFSEPVIIENPDARIKLLPADHGGYLYEHLTASGRDWTVLGHHPLVKIKMSLGRKPIGDSTLDNTPVIVEFDRLNGSARTRTGRVFISWQAVAGTFGLLRLSSFADDTTGQHKLHWKRTNGSRTIEARGNEQYRVSLVRFQDDKGSSQCLPKGCKPLTGNDTVTVSICSQDNLADCN